MIGLLYRGKISYSSLHNRNFNGKTILSDTDYIITRNFPFIDFLRGHPYPTCKHHLDDIGRNNLPIIEEGARSKTSGDFYVRESELRVEGESPVSGCC